MKLLERLTEQLKATKAANPAELAKTLLIKRGHMNEDGSLTAEGKKREAMGAANRAIDRAVKRTGHSAKEFKYNPKTNRATLKGK